MADMLETGAAWLDSQRHAHMAQTVVYSRGGDSVEVAATIGRTEFEQTDEFGVVYRIESRDFLLRTADLILNGSPTLPQAGDRIRETGTGKVFVYEVMAPGGEPPCRYGDNYRMALRIHTKHVGTEDIP